MLCKSTARQILGISHIVLGVKDFQEGEEFVSKYGYLQYGEKTTLLNPTAKSPFLRGTAEQSCSLKLMTGLSKTPPIELLCESVYHQIDNQVFEAILGNEKDKGPQEMLEVFKQKEPANQYGFREIKSGSAEKSGIMAALVHCNSLSNDLVLWELLGLKPFLIDKNTAYVKIKSLMSDFHTILYFVADSLKKTKMYLNQGGIVCLSFLCKDSDSLREALKDNGYFTGDCFTFTPFKQPLRIFFARNTSGEIYEFISTAGDKEK